MAHLSPALSNSRASLVHFDLQNISPHSSPCGCNLCPSFLLCMLQEHQDQQVFLSRLSAPSNTHSQLLPHCHWETQIPLFHFPAGEWFVIIWEHRSFIQQQAVPGDTLLLCPMSVAAGSSDCKTWPSVISSRSLPISQVGRLLLHAPLTPVIPPCCCW